MAKKRFAPPLAALILALWVSPAAAVDPPETVSPGSPNRVSRIPSRCPTFSWAAVSEAQGLELVVYAVDGLRPASQDGELQPVLRQQLPGSAVTWTPGLGQCLEPGGRYAWSLRAVGEEGAGDWSEIALFEISRAPSVEEIETAMEVLRRYLRSEALSVERVKDDAWIFTEVSGAARAGVAGVASSSSSFLTLPAAIHAEPADNTVANIGVRGVTSADPASGPYPSAGVAGIATSDSHSSASGVYGAADQLRGTGVRGVGDLGVVGSSLGTDKGVGVLGLAQRPSGSTFGVAGESRSSTGYGGFFLNTAGGDLIAANDALFFGASSPTDELEFRVDSSGNVYADGSYNCGLKVGSCFNTGVGADVAERIDVTDTLEAGDVVEIDPGRPGRFRKSRRAYSSYVVGVVSALPAITLNNNDLTDNDTGERTDDRPLLALVGKVPVNATLENGPVRPGDLLTASSTPGYAMRCEGLARCFGRTIGKALEPLEEQSGRILMMVVLQ